MEEYDVIIVGLGCVGLATAYYCAKKGMKVLGIEQFHKSGSLGGSSFGETRLWRVTHGDWWKNDMMRDAVELWKEIEEESGEEILMHYPVLTIGSFKAKDFSLLAAQYPDEKLMTSTEVMEKFPALKNLPDDYHGILKSDCGVIRAKKAIATIGKLAQENHGATFHYSTKVEHITKNQVTTTDGQTFHGKHVAVCCGAYSMEFDGTATAAAREIEYIVFDDPTGMPKGIIEFCEDGNEYYGMVDGPNLDQYKMGQFNTREIKNMVRYFRERLPDKFDHIKYFHPWFITIVDSGEFQYKTDEKGVHYAYGFSGTGFKFMPLHGKIVCDGLIGRTFTKYIASEFKAKL